MSNNPNETPRPGIFYEIVVNPRRTVRFTYKNYRGEVSERRVVVHSIQQLSYQNKYHPGMWCLHGHCLDKQEPRSFAFSGILSAIVDA